jgi:hypothetical protein
MRSLMALSLSLALAGGAAAAEIKGTSRIDAVTVYPAGAEVVRKARVKLGKGEHTVLFVDFPAETVAASIRVEGKATAGLEIGSVDTRKLSVPRSDDEAAASERRQVEEAIEKLKDERSALQTAIQAAEMQKKLIENLTGLPGVQPPANGGAQAQPDWGQLFELIGKRTAEAQKAILDTQIKVRGVDRQIKDLEGKLASLAPRKMSRTEVKVALTAEADLDADMTIRYQVTSASWTPFYDARLTVGSKAEAPKLQLVRRAAITQRTGEVWDNVTLALSTARPTAGTSASVLAPMTIDFEPERPVGKSMAAPPPPSAAPMPKSSPVDGAFDEEDRRFGKVRGRGQKGQREDRGGRGAGLPGRLRHRRTHHGAGYRRDQARADRRDEPRSGAHGAGCAQARGEGLPLREDHHLQGLPAAARSGGAVPRQRIHWQRLAAAAGGGGGARIGLWCR